MAFFGKLVQLIPLLLLATLTLQLQTRSAHAAAYAAVKAATAKRAAVRQLAWKPTAVRRQPLDVVAQALLHGGRRRATKGALHERRFVFCFLFLFSYLLIFLFSFFVWFGLVLLDGQW